MNKLEDVISIWIFDLCWLGPARLVTGAIGAAILSV